MHHHSEYDEDAPVLDEASPFALRTEGPPRPETRGLTVLWWSLIALVFCLALIAMGVFVLGHLGLEGVRPIDPRDSYFGQ